MRLVSQSTNSGVLFDLDKLDAEVKELTQVSEDENFWSNSSNALKVIARLNYCKNLTETYRKLQSDQSDLSELLELADDSLLEQINESFETLKKEAKDFELEILFSGEFDSNNAILEIHPGAGGTEAQDWADMLYRMYVLYAEAHKFKMSLISLEPGEEAGVKSVTLKIAGHNAYGLLKSEKGVHRLVRISPFDANKRRHTSFASVNVIPEFKENSIDIQINEWQLFDYRGHRKIEQWVDKLPKENCKFIVFQEESIGKLNFKEMAMNMLKSKLYLIELEKREKKLNDIVGEKKNIEWGSQIRSYVFCPYTLVKDNRTNYETTDVEGVMNGGIDGFLYAYLREEAKKNA